MATWIIDPDHSCAAFAVRHFALAHVRGQFSQMKGRLQFDPADKAHASVEVEIEVANVSTGVKKRDEHLLSGDFFDQSHFPTITFKSAAVDFINNNRCRVTGNLTIRGISRPVTFEGEYAGPQTNPFGDELSVGFCGATTVNREDFGIMWGSEPMEGGGLVAGKEVEIFLEMEADRTEG